MKSLTSTTTIAHAHVLLLLLLVAVQQLGQEVAAHSHHTGHKKNHHPNHHVGHHHDGHHAHQEVPHHGPRAARTRREKEDTTKPPTGTTVSATEIPQEAIPCTVGGSECDVLVNSECDSSRSQCTCPTSYPILDLQNSYCVREAKLNTTCQFSSQCEEADEYSFCGTASICVCRTGYSMEEFPNVGFNCVSESGKPSGADPAMIGVLAGLALMFVIICVVLRLFSKARFRENRSIFNTPNPRLMNASLFKDSKLLSPARGERRGSRASVRAPSRAPSVTSVNAASRSPNGSLAKGRRGSALSAVSATGSANAASGGAPSNKSPSPSKEHPKSETTVAIENVD